MKALAALAVLTLAGCATAPRDAARQAEADAAELADAVKGRTAGEPQRCINNTNLDNPRIIGEAILYRQGNRLWLSQAEGGCVSLRGDPLLVVEQYGSQLCQNDRFRTVPRGASIPGPYCRFSAFTPYSRPD